MLIDDILRDESAIFDLRAARREDVLAELAAALAAQTGLAPTLVLERLREREAQGCTATGRGIALPHATLAVPDIHGVLGIARTGVEFDAPDDAPVKLFLALATPRDRSKHLSALACVARTFCDQRLVEQILACPNPKAILALVREQARGL